MVCTSNQFMRHYPTYRTNMNQYAVIACWSRAPLMMIKEGRDCLWMRTLKACLKRQPMSKSKFPGSPGRQLVRVKFDGSQGTSLPTPRLPGRRSKQQRRNDSEIPAPESEYGTVSNHQSQCRLTVTAPQMRKALRVEGLRAKDNRAADGIDQNGFSLPRPFLGFFLLELSSLVSTLGALTFAFLPLAAMGASWAAGVAWPATSLIW